MMRSGAVEKEKTLHARGPGFDSRQGFFFSFFESFCFVSFLFSTFFHLLTGFNLFTVILLYSFTRFCVNRFSIFAYKV